MQRLLTRVCVYAAAKTSMAAEAMRPARHMKRSLVSARKNRTISSPFRGRRVNLSGSATHARTSRNSRGPCSHELRSKALSKVGPPIFWTSMRVAPRLKKPNRPPVNNENAVSKLFLRDARRGGVQLTFPIISGYAKERITGTQLFRKINSMRESLPNSVATRTGPTIRKLMRSSMKSRKVREDAVTNAPASAPRPNATRVTPNAISINFMVDPSSSTLLCAGVG